jgi:gas vesicle protein
MSKAVTAVFSDSNSAENAARQIKEEGLRTEDISVVAKHGNNGDGNYDARGDGLKDNGAKDNGVRDNISDGVLTGGVIGSLAGLLIGAGTLMVPGLGIVAAAGPVTGFLAGGAVGGVAGGLIDLGIPEEKSKKYESDIKSGKILFAMNAEEKNIDRVSDILRRNGAEKVEVH